MIGLFMALAARTGAAGRAQGIVAVIIAIAAALALAGTLAGAWKAFDWFNDRQAANRALDKRDAQTKGRVIVADREAGAAKGQRDAANANLTESERERIDDAQAAGCDPLDGLFGLCP